MKKEDQSTFVSGKCSQTKHTHNHHQLVVTEPSIVIQYYWFRFLMDTETTSKISKPSKYLPK